MPLGHRAQLMQATFDRLVDRAEEAADRALSRAGSGAKLSIAISCIGRRLVLGDLAETNWRQRFTCCRRGSRKSASIHTARSRHITQTERNASISRVKRSA